MDVDDQGKPAKKDATILTTKRSVAEITETMCRLVTVSIATLEVLGGSFFFSEVAGVF